MPVKFFKNVKNWEQFEIVLTRAITKAFTYLGRTLSRSIERRAETFHFTRDYQLNVRWLISGRGLNTRFEMFDTSEHADVVEGGRGANKKAPPVEAIMSWVAVKIHPRQKELRGTAFVVARSIGRKGFPGHFLFRDVVGRNPAAMRDACKIIETEAAIGYNA